MQNMGKFVYLYYGKKKKQIQSKKLISKESLVMIEFNSTKKN